ncbi:MAG: PspA-associated protein PspAA [Egibacteraceae bacterium]
MIVRILGEGQFDVPDSALDGPVGLNELDGRLTEAVEAADNDAFTAALSELLAAVRGHATPHPADSLDPSDLVLPGPDSSLDEVRKMLGAEGLIPG